MKPPVKLLFTHAIGVIIGAVCTYLAVIPNVASTAQSDSNKSAAERPAENEKTNLAKAPISNPLEAKQILDVSNSVNRRAAFQSLLNNIRTFEEAKNCYDALMTEEANGRIFPDLKNALLERAGAVAGEKFAELLVPSDKNSIPDASLGPVIKGWAGIDPVKAVQWVNRAEGSFKILLSTALIEGAGGVNPDYAKNTFASLPPPAQAAAISAILDIEATRGGLPALKTWADEYLENVESKSFNPSVKGSMMNEAFEKVAARVVKGDRNEALSWLSKQWENDYIATGLQNKVPDYAKSLTKDWVEKDPDGMGEWLNQNKNSIAYDRMTEQFVSNIASLDYESAVAWVGTIGNPEIQKNALRNIEFKKAFTTLIPKPIVGPSKK